MLDEAMKQPRSQQTNWNSAQRRHQQSKSITPQSVHLRAQKTNNSAAMMSKLTSPRPSFTISFVDVLFKSVMDIDLLVVCINGS